MTTSHCPCLPRPRSSARWGSPWWGKTAASSRNLHLSGFSSCDFINYDLVWKTSILCDIYSASNVIINLFILAKHISINTVSLAIFRNVSRLLVENIKMIFSQENSSSQSYQEVMQLLKQMGMLVMGSLLADLVVRFFLFCGNSSASKSTRKCFEKTLLGYDRVGYWEDHKKSKIIFYFCSR